ncbi:hypothetical protein [Brachyspira murdochii]|uniref:hypothetical protein n=1 Tax=Brachyspira murdochii TaxID=84378 RepID=UPI0012F4D9F2|nr:hypothetical protein [Brachyspira murdochii]
MKKILIFMLILIFSISCNNTSKTGSSYNNSSSSNTEQENQNGTSTTDNNKEWLDKVSGRNIQNSNVNYEFDSNGNIEVNGEKRWTFVKYLGEDKGLYYEEVDPSDMLFDKPSDKIEKIYGILTIIAPNDNVYFLDGYKSTSWTEKYRISITVFVNENSNEPENADWNQYPHMTENDLDTTQKGDNWGYLNPVK